MTLKKISFLMILAISITGCNNNPQENLNIEANNTSVIEPTEYELKLKKSNTLSENLSDFSVSASEAYHSYISSFGNDADHYSSKEVTDFLDINANDVQKLNSLDDALEIPVLEDLNALIISYKINARAFSVAINSCERYYSSKGYKKDKFESGKAMHKPVIEIFARFSVIDSLLKVKMKKVSLRIKNEHMKNLTKDNFNNLLLVDKK